MCHEIMMSDDPAEFLDRVIYYIDPKCYGASLSFIGGKERTRIPITTEHNSLEALKRHVVDYAGLKEEAVKSWLSPWKGMSFEL